MKFCGKKNKNSAKIEWKANSILTIDFKHKCIMISIVDYCKVFAFVKVLKVISSFSNVLLSDECVWEDLTQVCLSTGFYFLPLRELVA